MLPTEASKRHTTPGRTQPSHDIVYVVGLALVCASSRRFVRRIGFFLFFIVADATQVSFVLGDGYEPWTLKLMLHIVAWLT